MFVSNLSRHVIRGYLPLRGDWQSTFHAAAHPHHLTCSSATHTHTGHWSSVTSWGDLFQLPDQQQWNQRCVYLDESAEYKAPGSLLTAPCRIGGILLRIKSRQTRRNTLWRFHTRLKRPHQGLRATALLPRVSFQKEMFDISGILATFCISLWLLWMDFFQWFLLLVPKENSRLNKYLFGV